MKWLLAILLLALRATAQDTTLLIGNQQTTLPEVFVRNHFDYQKLLKQIQDDTTFYKAFKNLRILNYTSLNHIQMVNKKGLVQASLQSKTKQLRKNGCRTMQILEEQVTGDMYNKQGAFNYLTAQLYASLFFTNGQICGESNIVSGLKPTVSDKKGIDKHKEQLKMLFFNPGKKISGIPFIGDKLDVYDTHAQKLYNYKLDYVQYKGTPCYLFSILPKSDLGVFKQNGVVVDEMNTWFDSQTLTVLARTYRLSYKAGVYDFDVSMEVEMDKVGNLVVPVLLRYKGNWDVLFKKREIGLFTATLFGFSNE